MKRGTRKFLKNKAGLSEIVATLIVILLVIIAIGIIWGVLRNFFKGGSEQVNFDGLTLDMEITRASVNAGGTAIIGVKRNAGSGDITGVKLIFFDGSNSHSVDKETSMLQGEEKTFTVTSEEISGIEDGWTISVAPIFLTSAGKEQTGSVAQTVTLGSSLGGGDAPAGDVCGDAVCQESESELTCPADCAVGEPPGATCEEDADCQLGYSCTLPEGTCSSTCNFDPVESVCDGLTYQCGSVIVCGQTVDCTAELGACGLGTYCSVNTCTADTFINTGTVEDVFTSAEPFSFTSADLPSPGTLNSRYVNFTGLNFCRMIEINSIIPEGTASYARINPYAPGLTTGLGYTVWTNTQCGNYFA